MPTHNPTTITYTHTSINLNGPIFLINNLGDLSKEEQSKVNTLVGINEIQFVT